MDQKFKKKILIKKNKLYFNFLFFNLDIKYKVYIFMSTFCIVI